MILNVSFLSREKFKIFTYVTKFWFKNKKISTRLHFLSYAEKDSNGNENHHLLLSHTDLKIQLVPGNQSLILVTRFEKFPENIL